jgi:hypothetical protein
MMPGTMSPALIALFLVAALVALVPVRRLHVAGWSAASLFTAWVVYSIGIFVGIRFPGPFRLILPILLVAYVAPFVARPERLARFLGRRSAPPRPVINVTPAPMPGLPDPDGTPKPRRAAERSRRPPEEIR